MNITLNNQVHFQSIENQSILDSALAQNVVLEYSCKTGQCGVCKSRVLQGETEVLTDEISLSQKDIEEGWILTCCRQAKTDIILDVEELSELKEIEVKTSPCRIDEIERVSKDVIRVLLRFPPQLTPKFLAGQYADIIKNDCRRSYSMANAPRVDGKVELLIRQVESGLMSQYWFNEAKVNDLLRAELPKGTFFLRERAQLKKLIFLATGTGIAPIKAMLEAMSVEKYASTEIFVFWGGRNEEHFFEIEFPCNLEIKFFKVMSRADMEWNGERGYVQDVALTKLNDLEKTCVYACGSIEMIQSAQQKMVEHGLDPNNFFADAFVSSK